MPNQTDSVHDGKGTPRYVIFGLCGHMPTQNTNMLPLVTPLSDPCQTPVRPLSDPCQTPVRPLLHPCYTPVTPPVSPGPYFRCFLPSVLACSVNRMATHALQLVFSGAADVAYPRPHIKFWSSKWSKMVIKFTLIPYFWHRLRQTRYPPETARRVVSILHFFSQNGHDILRLERKTVKI